MGKVTRIHGNMREYRAGCRCEECKEANNSYMKAYREKQRSMVESIAFIEEGDTSWVASANCKGEGTNTFFPTRGDNSLMEKAKAICSKCEVSRQCLAYATRTEQTVGVWGGKSARERSAITYLIKETA